MNIRALLIVFSMAVLPSTVTYAFDVSQIERPTQYPLQWVSKELLHNGMPMQLMQLQTARDAAAVQLAFEQHWQQAGYFVSHRTAGDWQLLSTIIDEHNVVLQLREEKQMTVALLSAVPLDRQLQSDGLAQRFPKPWGTKTLSASRSMDGGHTATTLVLHNETPLYANRAFYQRALRSAGWQIDLDQQSNGTVSIFARSERGILELAMRQDKQQTLLFANIRHGGSNNAF